ncbi:hypothetical protein PIB30_068844 [Stylosanthes scabra]|uniref:MADS-box domain-containing protein n=1 Tax=Stylosanthes scabra TaxID=79078 RepID=A0ABU6ZLR2_9FABA|nr:hypothetical protein [Stylosanthes scabra]
MARSKVKLAYITNDSSRRVTYKKRKRGLMKKINELSTLCGVDACAIVYNSREDSHPLDEPEVWPSREGVEKVVEKFRKMSTVDQSKKRMDHVDYLNLRISKEEERLKKKRNENCEKEFILRMNDYMQTKQLPENLTMLDLNNMAYYTDMKLREVELRMQILLDKENKEKEREKEKMKMMDIASSSMGPAPPLESPEEASRRMMMNPFSFFDEGNYSSDGLEVIIANAMRLNTNK